jgi:nicotinamidase-related amidase
VTSPQPAIDPKRTALLLMDYQAGVVPMVPDPETLLERAAGAVSLVRAHGGRIGYVRVAFEDADYDAFPATSSMGQRILAADRTAYHADAPATAIHDQVTPEPGDIVVRKTRVGAFSTTDLDEQLRREGIDTLILAGIATSGVVLSTVRDASDRDYRLFVLADATADRDPAVHEFLLAAIFPRQATVITTADLGALLARSGRQPDVR